VAKGEEFLTHLWTDVINAIMREGALENVVKNCRLAPEGAFGDTGPAIERLLATGASRSDLRLVLRAAAYEAVFGTLYALSDPGLDEPDAIGSLYGNLLMTDPSGMEGRPGSAEPSET
jgi:hypothetical protein